MKYLNTTRLCCALVNLFPPLMFHCYFFLSTVAMKLLLIEGLSKWSKCLTLFSTDRCCLTFRSFPFSFFLSPFLLLLWLKKHQKSSWFFFSSPSFFLGGGKEMESELQVASEAKKHNFYYLYFLLLLTVINFKLLLHFSGNKKAIK